MKSIPWLLLIAITAIVLLLTSCTTTRYVDRVQIKTDSTAIHQRDSMIRVYKLDSAGWNSMIEMLSHNEVVFRDTGSTRIEYYPDGSIHIIEGQVKNLNSRLSKSVQESWYWKSAYDSLFHVKSKDSTTVSIVYRTVTITKKKRPLWWLWLAAGFGAGLVIAYRKKIVAIFRP